MEELKVHFAIHDLNETGGQDRSTLEILRRIQTPFAVHAFTVSDPKIQKMNRTVWPNIRRPVLLKILYYYLCLFFRGSKIWHATGVSHFRSSIIHLQFIHTSWEKQTSHPLTLRGLYAKTLALWNIWLEKICFRQGKTYIAISHQVAHELKVHFGLTENVVVIHHGVDPEKFSPGPSSVRQELGIDEQVPCFLFAGSFERKGLATVLQAFGKKSISHPLLILGEGNREHYQAIADQYGLKNIYFLGKQKNIERFFRAADAFLLPTQYEPFGLVILEALSCGVPVITSRCAGAAELIQDGQEGFLLDDPKNAELLGEKITFLAEQPKVRESMKKAAREVGLKNSWDQVAKKYDQVLQKVLQSAQKSR
jgi:glycosyltransferase involved in cell wall biosynthesis